MTVSHLTKTVAAAAAVAATVSGCSHSSSRTTADRPSSPSTLIETSSTGPRSTTRLDLGAGAGPIALSSRDLYFPSSQTKDGDWDRVISIPLKGGKASTFATTQFSNGLINWVAASDDGWVYYVDQSRKQSDADPKVLWRVVAVNPASGAKRELASNGSSPNSYVPIVRSQGRFAFWTSAEADRTAREYLWKPGWSQPHNLLRHTEMTPGSESINGNAMVYLGKAANAEGRHTTGGDCWSVPLVGGRPTALTHTALAMGCTASDGWVVWSQHIGPEDAVPQDDGVLDDPFKLLAEHDGAAPVVLHEGYFSLANIYLAGDVAVWQNTEGLRVLQRLDDPRTQTVLSNVGVAQAVAVDDDHLVITHRQKNRVAADVIDLHSAVPVAE